MFQPYNGHNETADQRTIIQQLEQYGNWYIVVVVVVDFIDRNENSEHAAPPSPILAVPNVTTHPSTASVPTSYYLMWHHICQRLLKR